MEFLKYVDECILYYGENIDNHFNPAKYLILHENDVKKLTEETRKHYMINNSGNITLLQYYKGLMVMSDNRTKEGHVIVSSVYNDLIFEKVNK